MTGESSAPTAPASPVAPEERIAFWDVLRGFAVLGILVANIPMMAMAGALTDMGGRFAGGEDSALDRACLYVTFVLFDTKFITIFSLLFGVGLAWISERVRARGGSFAKIYGRRLAVLLGIGFLHATLLWFGDILGAYALIGFVAMAFHKRSVTALLVWAAVLLALNAVVMSSFGLLDPAEFIEPGTAADGTPIDAATTLQQRTAHKAAVLSSGSFGEMTELRLSMYFGSLPIMLAFFGLRTLGMFLLGIAAIRSGLFVRIREHRGAFRNMMILGIPAGLVLEGGAILGLVQESAPGPNVLAWTFLYFGGAVLAAGYVGAIALWCMSDFAAGLRARIGAVGRMALTSYLSHSLIATIVFNWFGWFDRLRRHELFLVVAAIYLLQLWLSPIWLRRFRYGPVEWVWRVLTYGRGPAGTG